MKGVLRAIAIVFVVIFLIYVSLLSLGTAPVVDKKLNVATLIIATPAISPAAKEPQIDINDLPLKDNLGVYQFDAPNSLVTIYLTVRLGNSSDNSNYTWQQVNDFSKYFGTNNEIVTVGRVDGIVQLGDENGPLPGELGYDAIVPNATIQIRGATTSLAPQKSYKIELFNSAGKWRGQSTLDLNKHVYDPTRLRNKLSFDLLKEIPDLISLRTQFVHLYVKDETTNPPKNTFADYGLFTQVEQPNQRYLRSRLLDPNGQFYKVNNFEFYRYPDQIREVTDPLYNEDAFSLLLEIKGSHDHAKLIQMLDDVNNYSVPIEETFTKYFNSDNYFTWMAFNILVGNIDTETQNYFLYSPQNGSKWYFIPWDYDGAFPLQNKTNYKFQYSPWESGITTYWGSVLHNRILRVDKYRQLLDEKINMVKAILTPEKITNMIDGYRTVTDTYNSRMPDIYYAPTMKQESEMEYKLIPEDIQNNYNLYIESLKKPMPFYLGTPSVEENQLKFNWDEAYDFGGSDIIYDFVVSTDWEFKNIIVEKTLADANETSIDLLKPGTYFWKVTAKNQAGGTQIPFDGYSDTASHNHYGLKYFFITTDNQVLEQ